MRSTSRETAARRTYRMAHHERSKDEVAVRRYRGIWSRLLAVVVTLAGCGGGSSDYPSSAVSGGQAYYAGMPSSGGESYNYQPEGAASGLRAAPAPPMDSPVNDVQLASAGSSDGESESYDSDDSGGDQAEYAQNAPPQAVPTPQPAQTVGPTPHHDADDAHRGPLLIYQATLHLSVFEVETTQRTVTTIAQELGGFLARQNDQEVVIRVPAAKFRDALGRIAQVGDVLHRNIEALDVSEEFRDVQIRLRNAEVVRDRLAALMAQARTVQEALSVQVELERITGVIEQLKGRMQYLGDRIAYSTITIHFQPAPDAGTDQPDVFRLPFPWLDELSLRSLLNLPYQE